MRTLKTTIRLYILVGLAISSLTASVFAQPGKLELQHLEKLSDKAVEVNDVTLDGPMLQLAVGAVQSSHDKDTAQLKDVIQGVKGIYVKNFEFEKPNEYSAADVDAIRAQLARPGWSRVVESHDKRQGEHDEIYVFKDGDKVGGMAILVAEPKELTVVNIVGFIDIDKMGALGGQFGIPEEIKEESKDKPEKHKAKGSTPAKPDKKEDAHDDEDDDQ
jgi:hypothetical protein